MAVTTPVLKASAQALVSATPLSAADAPAPEVGHVTPPGIGSIPSAISSLAPSPISPLTPTPARSSGSVAALVNSFNAGGRPTISNPSERDSLNLPRRSYSISFGRGSGTPASEPASSPSARPLRIWPIPSSPGAQAAAPHSHTRDHSADFVVEAEKRPAPPSLSRQSSVPGTPSFVTIRAEITSPPWIFPMPQPKSEITLQGIVKTWHKIGPAGVLEAIYSEEHGVGSNAHTVVRGYIDKKKGLLMTQKEEHGIVTEKVVDKYSMPAPSARGPGPSDRPRSFSLAVPAASVSDRQGSRTKPLAGRAVVIHGQPASVEKKAGSESEST